jgi:hypothetical protein
MAQYNSGIVTIAPFWAQDFDYMVSQLRADLAAWNAHLPVVLGVQRVADRDRVYPWIGSIKQQQQGVQTANVLKAQMEVGGWVCCITVGCRRKLTLTSCSDPRPKAP